MCRQHPKFQELQQACPKTSNRDGAAARGIDGQLQGCARRKLRQAGSQELQAAVPLKVANLGLGVRVVDPALDRGALGLTQEHPPEREGLRRVQRCPRQLLKAVVGVA